MRFVICSSNVSYEEALKLYAAAVNKSKSVDEKSKESKEASSEDKVSISTENEM